MWIKKRKREVVLGGKVKGWQLWEGRASFTPAVLNGILGAVRCTFCWRLARRLRESLEFSSERSSWLALSAFPSRHTERQEDRLNLFQIFTGCSKRSRLPVFDRLFETQASSPVNLPPNVLVNIRWKRISSVLFCVHTASNNVPELTNQTYAQELCLASQRGKCDFWSKLATPAHTSMPTSCHRILETGSLFQLLIYFATEWRIWCADSPTLQTPRFLTVYQSVKIKIKSGPGACQTVSRRFTATKCDARCVPVTIGREVSHVETHSPFWFGAETTTQSTNTY